MFVGDWGRASTSRKITRSVKAVSGDFLCLWVQRHCLSVCNVFKHKHCLPDCLLLNYSDTMSTEKSIEVAQSAENDNKNVYFLVYSFPNRSEYLIISDNGEKFSNSSMILFQSSFAGFSSPIK